jgi:hypothetical protein
MQIPVEPEAKKRAVKTKQTDFAGKEVPDESNECYFCGIVVDVHHATITKASLGHVVCVGCVIKVMEVVFYAGARNIT